MRHHNLFVVVEKTQCKLETTSSFLQKHAQCLLLNKHNKREREHSLPQPTSPCLPKKQNASLNYPRLLESSKNTRFWIPIPLHFMDNFNTYQTLKEHVRFTFASGGGAYLASGSWLKLPTIAIQSRVAQIQWELLLNGTSWGPSLNT